MLILASLCYAEPSDEFLQGMNLHFKLERERVEQESQVGIHGRK